MRTWLGILCALVLAMVVVGGITRLTGSGLSIVEWRPVTGALPPLGDRDWAEAFAAYRQSPEYRLVNAGMSLSAFKAIFAWEWAHRFLARLLGVAFVVPLVSFAVRRRISRALAMRLAAILALGAIQAIVGWIMVASGLVDVPHVSHLRLAAHLALALVLFGLLFWTWLELGPPCAGNAAPRATRLVLWTLSSLTALQMILGALTAGLRAGVGYNTFPKMHGVWIPPDVSALAPAWRNLVDNPATVQLAHRALGTILVLGAVTTALVTRRAAIIAFAAAAVAQMALGVATLVLVVPVPLAAVHQSTGFVVWALALAALRATRSGVTARRAPPQGVVES